MFYKALLHLKQEVASKGPTQHDHAFYTHAEPIMKLSLMMHIRVIGVKDYNL